jgi:hypothetical protein
MRIHSLLIGAVVAVMFVSGQQLAAQSMSPYGYGAPAGYGMPAGPYVPGANYLGVQPASGMVGGGPSVVSDAGEGCNECGDATCGGSCCDCWCNCVAVFGEFLFLRSRDSEVAYGVPIDGPIVGPPTQFPIQVGRTGMVDQDYQPGFRFGATWVIDGWSSLTAQYMRFEGNRTDEIDTAAPDVIRSLVSHPGTLTAAQDFLNAGAGHDIRFDLIDIDYRGVIQCCDTHTTNWLVGLRYAEMEQDFWAVFRNTGTETVETDIDFYGAGLRVGFEGERYSRGRRLFAYGKTAASLMVGEFRADYSQSQSFDPSVVDTNWKAGRIMPILDLEVGAGWQSSCGTWRLSAGYLFSGWFNTVKTDEYIQSVRKNNYTGLGDTMTFDGLVARVEGRF